MTKSSAWVGEGQARLVRLMRLGVLSAVVALALATAAVDSNDVVGTASAVGLVLLVVGTAATCTPAFRRADTWVMLTVPLVDLAAIAALHLVPGVAALAFLAMVPATWLGIVAGGRGVVITVAGTLVLFSLPVYSDGAPPGGWAEFLMIAAGAGIVSGATVLISGLWDERLAQLAQALSAVQEHQAHIEAIFDAVPVGMLEISEDGRYLLTNARHHDVVALSHPGGHAGHAGETGHVFAADNHTPLKPSELPSARAAAGEAFDDYVLWLGAEEEQRRAVSVSARQMRRQDGTPGGSVLAYHDITDLMRALSVKEGFVASVSHELRTPLTSIIGYLDLAQEHGDALPADISHFLTVASRNADRLLVLVSDLLSAAHAERVALELDRAPTDLPALVRRSVSDAADLAAGAAVILQSRIEPVPPAMVDAARLQQVVEHLLANAVKYTKPGGLVSTSLALIGETLVLEVADTGTGISSTDQLSLFEKFFRAGNAASSNIPGIGMGLALCKAIVNAHDGQIEVSSEVGVGTTMRVSLPFAAHDAHLSVVG